MRKGKKNTSIQLADLTLEQIKFCRSRTGFNQSEVVAIAIDRFSKDLIRELEFMSNPEYIEITLKGIRKLDPLVTLSKERRRQDKGEVDE